MDRHEWTDQHGAPAEVVAGSNGHIAATREQLADEVLHLASALAEAQVDAALMQTVLDQTRRQLASCEIALDSAHIVSADQAEKLAEAQAELAAVQAERGAR